MVIFDKIQKHSLLEFGIEIPISNSKATKSIEFLTNHPLLKNNISKWLIDKVIEKISIEDLKRVHSEKYIENLFSDNLEEEIIRTYELIDKNGNFYRYNPENKKLPFSDLLNNILINTAGTYQCCKVALEKKFCFYFGGGMHHAKFNYGDGFCLINDVVISLRKLQNENKIKTAWVIDVDAHKGDGTATLTSKDQTITTLSIHMANGWPLDGEMFINGDLNPSFIPSDIDIPIEKDEEYLYISRLKEGLEDLRLFGKPDITLVVLGSDPYEKDELPSSGNLKLTLEQLKERDLLIYNFLKEQNIPQAHIMAGGYGKSSWQVYSQFLETVLPELINN
jgi:acetoin utilization deacetylase AcuC-like enzyme